VNENLIPIHDRGSSRPLIQPRITGEGRGYTVQESEMIPSYVYFTAYICTLLYSIEAVERGGESKRRNNPLVLQHPSYIVRYILYVMVNGIGGQGKKRN
jgi:hypothetical protein